MALFKFGGNDTAYVRTSVSYALTGGENLIECDTDAGVELVLTLPPDPLPLEEHEVWKSTQGGGTVTINPSGKTIQGPTSISAHFQSVHLTWIPIGAGYWYSRL